MEGLYQPPPLKRQSSHWRDILIALAATGTMFYLWIGQTGVEFPVLLGALAIVVVMGFERPAIPCILFVIFSFLRVHEAFEILNPWKIPQILAQVSIIVVFWHLVLARTMKPFWTRELTIFAIFFVLATATVATAVSRELAFKQWSDLFSKVGLITVIVAWTTRTPGDFHLINRMFVLFGSAVASVAIYNKLNGIGLVEGTRVTIGRATGSVLGDPNDLALALLFPLSFAGSLIIGRVNIFDRFLGLAGFVTIFSGIICTQSRGGLLGITAVLALLGSRFIKSRALLITIGVVGVLGLFTVAGISGRQSGGAAEEGIDESSQGRLNAWETAWNMAKARPLTGVGLANFAPNYFFFTNDWDGKPHAVHSTWFGILAETGFPGIAAFLTLVGATALVARRSLKVVDSRDVDPRLKTAAVALAAGLASFCVSGTFLTQGFSWPFYMIFAMTVALSRVLSLEQPQEPPLAADLSPLPLRETDAQAEGAADAPPGAAVSTGSGPRPPRRPVPFNPGATTS